VLAFLGVAISAALVLVSTDLGRRMVVSRIVQAADEALAGRIELRSFHLLTGGGVELVGLRVVDPDGEVVLAVERASVYADVSRLRSKVLGARVLLERPEVVLKREEDGGLSIARAFEPAHPSPAGEKGKPSPWAFRLARLVLRGGSVRYVDAAQRTAFQADDLEIDARGAYGPRGGRAELALRGSMVAPERAPLSLQAACALRGSELRVSTLRAAAGSTGLELVGEVDLASLHGRAALLSLNVDAGELRGVAPGVPLAADVSGTLYAESDGRSATAAIDLRPRDGGTMRGAAAIRLPPPSPTLPPPGGGKGGGSELAAGVDLHLASLDLARVLRGAPATSLSLDLRGRGSGTDLGSLRASASASLAPSRVRGGRVGPAELRASFDRGALELARLDLTLPGGEAHARGRWRRGGAIAGHVALDARDLAALRRNLSSLLDQPLPELGGAVRVEADVGGTEAAPTARFSLASGTLRAAGTSASGVELRGDVAGPIARPRASVEGRAARLLAGGLDLRSVELRARFDGRAGEASASGLAPALGKEPLALRLAGTLSSDGKMLALSTATLGWPGARFELAEPARIDLAGPAVDRFALAAGPQRIEVAGGWRGSGRTRKLEARARLASIDLAIVPAALLPPDLALAGRIDGELAARGSRYVDVDARVQLSDGAAYGLAGLSAAAALALDGKAQRVRVELSAKRAAGGELDARAELPVRLAPGAAPIAARVTASGVPLTEVLRVAKVVTPEPVDGTLALELTAGGTVAAPRLDASASLDGGRYGGLTPLSVALRLEAADGEARLTGRSLYQGASALVLEVKVPVRLGALLRDPGPTASALAAAPFHALAEVPGLDLAGVAGRAGIPEGLAGRLSARVELTGTARLPRGTALVTLAGGAYAGYRGLGGEIEARAGDAGVELSARTALEGDELARFKGSVALPPERLGDLRAREAARIEASLEVPGAKLERAGASIPLAGAIRGRASLSGTVGAPRLGAEIDGRKIEIGGRPLGDLTARASAGGRSLHAELGLRVPSGGTLEGRLDAESDLSLAALRRGDLRRAPARASLIANRLDIAFLPAVAPGVVRSASGALGLDLTASGPLGKLSPRGTISLADGQASIAEYGDWQRIQVAVVLSEDSFRLERFTASRKSGTLDLSGAVSGLTRRDSAAALQGKLRTRGLSIPRGGQELATVDVDAEIGGTVSATALAAEVKIPQATIKLPNRVPRAIQPLDERKDIQVGPRKKVPAAAAAAGPEERPYRVSVHVLVPNRFWIRSDDPRMQIELRADVTAEVEGEQLAVLGDVDTLKGKFEPIGGRVFDLRRGRIHFAGSEPTQGVLEILAVWDAPTHKVRVNVSGTIEKPEVKLSSDPPLDESQIALLIATGRTELTAGSGGVGTLGGGEGSAGAGKAALGVVASQFLKDVVADKLPVDTVTVDASQLRAGKYVTDKIYVGYTRRIGTPEPGENVNEARVEYQITPRWNFEVRYGDANTGGASLIWSKDY
jgi:translocation and assembly module TamB